MSALYQVMPSLSADERQALKADIAEHGVQVPVVVTEDGTIIDGHHRAQIAQELGIKYPTQTIEPNGMSLEALRSMAFRLNANRRQLSQAQRRDLIRTSLLADPGMSDREHAQRCGVDNKTVARVRKKMESTEEIPQLKDRKGADGKVRRRTVPKTTARHVGKQVKGNVVNAADRFGQGQPIETPAERKHPKCRECGSDIFLPGRDVCAKCELVTAEKLTRRSQGQAVTERTTDHEPACQHSCKIHCPTGTEQA